VEVAPPVVELLRRTNPAEEDVARCLQQALPFDHSLAVRGEPALAEERLQDRGVSLLDLQEQRVVLVPAQEQEDPATRTDAPDPDDLPREVDVAEALEQDAPVGRQASPIALEEILQLGGDAAGPVPVADQVGQRNEERWIREEPRLALGIVRQL